MVMGLIGAGLGVAAPIVANALGIGKANTRARTFDESKAYDPNAFHYGGTPGGADAAANRYAGLAGAAQGRTAAHADTTTANYGDASRYDSMGLMSRAGQSQAARLMMARARGLVPSIAQMQADRQMQQATAAQSSAAASARGAAGLAIAQQNAANNTATMQSAISNQAQINAAQERLAAENSAFGAYSGMRSGDAASAAEAARRAEMTAQTINQGNQFNTTQDMNQRVMNDAFTMGMTNDEINVRNAELTAGMNREAMLNGSNMNATNQNIGITKYNADREAGYYGQAMGALTGGIGAGAQMMGGGGSAPTPVAPPPVAGVSSTGSTNMVGVPQPGPTSDDRAKFGMSPLGLLFGGGGGGGAPTGTVDIGGKGYMSQDDIQRGASGLAGQSMPGMVGGGGVTGGNVDLGLTGGGGMGTSMGLLSDDRAKRAAYMLGRQDGAQQVRGDEDVPYRIGGPLQQNEEFVVAKDGTPEIRYLDEAKFRDRAAQNTAIDALADPMTYVSPIQATASGLAYAYQKSLANQARQQDEARQQFAPLPEGDGTGLAELAKGNGRALQMGQSGTSAYVPADRQRAEVASGGARGIAYASDPVTQQFAQGLAPIRFQYRPGMGPAGEQTGVRAQAAASQPVTASMINQRPDGLLQIDPHMGLSTALAGVGHLSKKQQETDRKLDGLLAAAARREGY